MKRFIACLMVLMLSAGPARAQSTLQILPFDGATGWVNSQPLTPEMLRGKIVLVDFWEYTCINCLRTLPYLEEWYKRYHNDGFVIVGVHTPEFSFSSEPANVEAAMKRLGVTWPVALDANYAIWKTYKSDSWPNEYLFDQNGHLVEQAQGEGNYQQTEGKIQKLLLAMHPGAHYPAPMALLPRDNYTKPGAVCYLGTDETFVRPDRIKNAPPGLGGVFRDPGTHIDGKIYLSGIWNMSTQSATSSSAFDQSYIALQYHAMQVVAVMRNLFDPIEVTVTEDAQPVPRGDAGSDIQYDAHGRSFVKVDAPRAYELLSNQKFGAHDLELSPLGPGVSIYSFAFESCEKAN